MTLCLCRCVGEHCGGQRLVSGTFLYHSLLGDSVSHWTWGLLIHAGHPVIQFTCLSHPSAGIRVLSHHTRFYMHAGDSNPGSHTCLCQVLHQSSHLPRHYLPCTCVSQMVCWNPVFSYSYLDLRHLDIKFKHLNASLSLNTLELLLDLNVQGYLCVYSYSPSTEILGMFKYCPRMPFLDLGIPI